MIDRKQHVDVRWLELIGLRGRARRQAQKTDNHSDAE
jgi:hypothetical protein